MSKKGARSVAIANNEPFFNTGKLCRNGHLADRRTSSGACVMCEKETNIKLRDANREKYRKYDRARWDRVKQDPTEKEKISKRVSKYRKDNRLWAMWLQRKSSAIKDGIKFEVSFKYIESIFTGICPILNVPIRFLDKGFDDFTPSIDKIIPELGYVEGNVAVISRRANTIKNSGTAEEHRLIADYIDRYKP